MCTYVKKLYELFELNPKERIICNTLSGECVNSTKMCETCGISIKKENYELTESQQFRLTKIFLSSPMWKMLECVSFKGTYEEGIAALVLGTWNTMSNDMKKDIESVVTLKGD